MKSIKTNIITINKAIKKLAVFFLFFAFQSAVVFADPVNDNNPNQGELSVTSTPAHAKVSIDGAYIGVSPITKHSLSPGIHELKVEADGYAKFTENIHTRPGGLIEIFPHLDKLKKGIRSSFGVGMNYFMPFRMPAVIKPGAYYYLYGSYMYQHFEFALEAGTGDLKHPQTYRWFGVEKTRDRTYTFSAVQLQIMYWFSPGKVFSPYVGILAGLSLFNEIDAVMGSHNDNRGEILGGKAGFNISLAKWLSINFEGKFFYQPEVMSRDVFGQTGIGSLGIIGTDYFHLMAFTAGGSITINF